MPWKSFLPLLLFLKPYRLWIALSILLALSGALLTIVFADLIKNLTDAALNAQYHTFLNLILLTTILAAVGMFMSYMSEYATTLYKTKCVRDLRNHVTGHLQQLPISYTDRQHSGDLISRLNSDVSKIEEFIAQIPNHIYQPLMFVGAFTYLMLLNWKLLLVTSLLIPLSSVVYHLASKPLEQGSGQLREHLAAANAVAQDMISGITVVKAFNLQDVLSEKYQTIAQRIKNQELYLSQVNAYLTLIWMALRFVPQLVLPLYGGYLILQGELTVGGLLAAARLIWYIFIPVEAFLGLIARMRETAPTLERVLKILDEPSEQRVAQAMTVHLDMIPIEMQGIVFGYEQEKMILNGLKFQLHKSTKVALVGPSGSGKSTILKLLCGFYKPQQGMIKLFGHEIHRADLAAVRANIALMSQDTYLFPATIAENIAYGRSGASQEEIVAAAKAANAHDFIMKLPQGYDTLVGERGTRLSGGQRQRVALARVILKDTSILLLDEPTSALDTVSEALVEEALTRFMEGRTVLIVAHRLSTIQKVDQVLVLDEGRIVESGTRETLMAKDSLYKQLYLRQTRTEEDDRKQVDGREER